MINQRVISFAIAEAISIIIVNTTAIAAELEGIKTCSTY
jgi:hypothetical protein